MTEPVKKACGIVMPISGFGEYTEAHWSDVLEILSDAIEEAGFEPNLVSNADDVGVIHKRIVQNLYDNPMVVCDVSGKNANVMFEMGMRLAFDKPIIIIKDSATSYSFDTSPIEHIGYPHDLRFAQIVEFKQKLADKIKATNEKATKDKHFSPFLKHFGEFKVARLETTEVSGQQYILDELKSLRNSVERMGGRPGPKRASPILRPGRINACMRRVPDDQIEEALKVANAYPGVSKARIVDRGVDHKHIIVESAPEIDLAPLKDALYAQFPH